MDAMAEAKDAHLVIRPIKLHTLLIRSQITLASHQLVEKLGSVTCHPRLLALSGAARAFMALTKPTKNATSIMVKDDNFSNCSF